MPVFDDKLPLDLVDFSQYMPELTRHGFDPDAIRSNLKSNLRLRSIVAGLPVNDATAAASEALVEAGISATVKSINDPEVELNVAEKLGQEAVVRLTERPALLVKNDSFALPPQRWVRLDSPYRSDVERLLPLVGRVDMAAGTARTMVGTAFVVNDDLIMTNMHVVEYFADPAPDYSRWTIRQGASPTVDFKAEHDIPIRKQFKITDVVLGHNRLDPERMKSLDLALLRVERLSFEPASDSLPKPVELSSMAPSNDDDKDLYLVGYPWTDNEHVVPPEIMQAIFNDIYQAKRLQPGEYGAAFDDFFAFSHDCSTLGGNSGSCVVDLQAGKVIGLHFRGLYKRSNYALQMWRLKEALSGYGLNFK